MVSKIYLICLWAIVVCCSCSEDNIDCHRKFVNQYEYNICPVNRTGQNIDTLNNLIQIVLKIKRQDGNNNPIYSETKRSASELANYFSFEFSRDVFLQGDQRKCSPVLYNFIRNYNGSPYVECLFTFDPVGVGSKDLVLVINDRVLGGGIVKFPIKI